MKRNRKLLVVLAGVALVVFAATFALARSGGSASATDSSGQFESLLAARAGLTTDTLHKIESAGLATAADRGVSKGMLTADQATAIKNLDVSPLLEQGFSDLAQATNASETDLFNGLAGGQSLAQVAAAHGVSRDDLKASIKQLVQSDVSSFQSLGVVTQSEIDQVNNLLTDANLDKLIDATLPQHLDHQR